MENNIEEARKEQQVELIKDILEKDSEAILLKVREDLKTQVITTLTYSDSNELSKLVSEFVQQEMTEDIKTILVDTKAELLNSIKEQLPKISAKFGDALLFEATKNMQVGSY